MSLGRKRINYFLHKYVLAVAKINLTVMQWQTSPSIQMTTPVMAVVHVMVVQRQIVLWI